MAKTIAALNATLSLDARRFQAGMKRARDPLRKFREETKRSQERLKAFAAQVDKPSFLRTAVGRVAALTTAFLVFRTIKRVLNETVDELDRMAKAARAVNIELENFATLSFIAELTGVAPEAFTKGIQKMVSSIGEAATGTGEALEAFREMRIDLTELSKLAPEDQFIAIAQALSRIDSINLKASFARDIFGRSGIQLLNLLNLGEEGIKKFQKLAVSAGVTTGLNAGAVISEHLKDTKLIFKEQTKAQTRPFFLGLAAAEDVLLQVLTKRPTRQARAEAERFAKLRSIPGGAIDVLAIDRQVDLMEEQQKAQKIAAEQASKQTGLFESMVKELQKPFTSERDRFLDRVLSTGLSPDRQQTLLGLFDAGEKFKADEERAKQIDSVLSQLDSDKESLVSRLAGLTAGDVGIGGAAATGQVGTLAGAQAASSARQGLARLQQVNEESKRLLLEINRTNREIAVNTRRRDRLEVEPIP